MLPLSSSGRHWLLGVARDSLEAAACGSSYEAPRVPAELAAADHVELDRPRAAFVTLHEENRLRGCVGHTDAELPLRVVVAEMARAAALEDTRFPTVAPEEVPRIELEISVLSDLFPISPDQIVPGTHGLLVRRGLRRGLLLPQVATAYDWDSRKFLEETCRKAGLPANAWKHGAHIEAFTADLIHE